MPILFGRRFMAKFSVLSFAFSIAALVGLSPAAASQDAATAQVLTNLKRAYPATSFTSVGPSAIPGLYEVLMGRNVAYTDASGRYFVFGNLMDMQTQTNLTQERTESLQRVEIPSLPIDQALKTVKGNGSRTLYVFSDPSCGFCKQLEPSLAALTDVTIYTFIVPMLGQPSMAAGAGIWCSKDRAKAWTTHMTGSAKAPSAPANCDHPLRKNLQLAEKLGITATPTLVTAQGTRVAGALPVAQLRALLEQAAGASATTAQGSTTGTVQP